MAAHSHQARISIRYSQAAEPSSAGISAAAMDGAMAGCTVGEHARQQPRRTAQQQPSSDGGDGATSSNGSRFGP
jgi:hypothetical protein